jgi:NADH:ubiquinone oxidoreductase subunit F (NADH-binding)
LAELSRRLDRPIHEIYGVASFYPEFHLSPRPRVEIAVCDALPCKMNGAEALLRKLKDRAKGKADVVIRRCPCLGACDWAPAVTIDGKLQTCNYARTAADLLGDAEAAIRGTGECDAWPPRGINGPFRTDPYHSREEHFGALKTLTASGDYPSVIKAVTEANLRGMGGAGKPADRKWLQVAAQKSDEKYVVCNADESEPGTLKDREILRNLSHLVVEGMIIAGLAVGATRGYVYLRHEYKEQHNALNHAISLAQRIGLLGSNVGGSGMKFNLNVFVSPGGYILGEATALLEALEGKRGQPRNQIIDLGMQMGIPSFNGLWGKPTLLNNVETFVYIPTIVKNGAGWFKDQGIAPSQGLKWASVCGDVNNPGVFEVSMGAKFSEVIERAGGVRGGRENFKAFAPSGPSYGFLPPAQADQTLDFRGWPAVSVGSGAIIVLDKSRCMIDSALNFTQFFRNESCGKCVPCRVGSQQMVNLIEMIGAGVDHGKAKALLESIPRLEELLEKGSICGLGQVVARPIQTVLKHWPDEVEAHLKNGRCPANVCQIAEGVKS